MSNKPFLTFLSILISHFLFAQGEANIWYFGQNAGLDFSTGNPVALTNGMLNTDEGCATICNAAGQLLFYTDGSTVYNRNHTIMSNGTGLLGNTDSTQSATIVPKPNSTTQFYIFTIDFETGFNGLRYSIVDMSLNSGLGAVTTDKNILVENTATEKFAITKKSGTDNYWITTILPNSNQFKTFLLSSSGISPAITTSIGVPIGPYTAGHLKFSPQGDKLIMCNTNFPLSAQLYDFNSATGILSNSITLANNGFYYGAEFSPDGNVLYIAEVNNSVIRQFNLNATDIPASRVNLNFNSNLLGALQLAPNGKIYVAQVDSDKLNVINNPNVVGLGANIQNDAVDLQGRLCQSGLPSFNQSIFFNFSITAKDVVCINDSVLFNTSFDSSPYTFTWDFGDGSTSSNLINPTHQYVNPGNYTVTLSLNSGEIILTKEIQVSALPTITNTVTLKQCDDNIDGFSVFNLTEANRLISNNFANETFSYFETVSDAQNNINPISNPTTYTNQTVSNDVVFVRVTNANGCFRVTTLNLNVSTTLIPNSFQRVFIQCDDLASGSNTDGLASFDFSSVTADIQALYPSGQLLDISYYKNQTDALTEQNAITNISNYTNIGYPNTQNIYIRVDSQINNDCLGLGHHITLNVEKIPIVQNKVINHCDDSQDGIFAFDTTNLQAQLLNGLTNVTVNYKDQSGNLLSSPLPNPFNTASQIINVRVTNNTSAGCFYDSTIQFIVDDLPEVFPLATSLTTNCDDEFDPMSQDGKYPFNTSTFQSTILGSQTGMIVNYYDESNNPLPSPLPNPFIAATQNVRIEVINPINTACKAIYSIPFVVNPIPKIDLNGAEIVCNQKTLIKTLEAGILDGTPASDYTYVWKRDADPQILGTNSTLDINQEGTYMVEVTNLFNCSRTRTITVVASDLATITNVSVSDLSSNNTIVVSASGTGDYMYSLDNITFQISNSFENVPAGVYNVYVKDLNGCGTAPPYEVSVLGIPSYFTPNGDGYNDYWNIKGINTKVNAKTQIYIFDRFGKLLKQVSPTSEGWNGTFNGESLPSTDYWYSLQLQDGRIMKGHFALKR